MKFKSYEEYLRDCLENVKKPVRYKTFLKRLYKQMDRETKQKVLDMILKPMKFGEIADKANISLDEVSSVYIENITKTCINSLNNKAK